MARQSLSFHCSSVERFANSTDRVYIENMRVIILLLLLSFLLSFLFLIWLIGCQNVGLESIDIYVNGVYFVIPPFQIFTYLYFLNLTIIFLIKKRWRSSKSSIDHYILIGSFAIILSGLFYTIVLISS